MNLSYDEYKKFIFIKGALTLLKSMEPNLIIISTTAHPSFTICKVSTEWNENCRRSYPETNMLKLLSKGL